ncbi:hypothetical protein N657DRAFT_640615 [Parathielavia appendiculata]|uniref:Uncharacterized protein n=1 Tax=Parathielavia appendiculata TaxID=2587402 RepID=A0AAN6U822_9PEZI|nr:hypothetical protein N657DRAFT_640615 [Parathielavia appendiculata]
MCTGIIGQCQCFSCMDLPTPGKVLRIDFCPTRQDELVGVWTPFSPQTGKLTPCSNLTFDRVRDPLSCHFRNMDVNQGTTAKAVTHTDTKLKRPEDVQKEESLKDAANHALSLGSASKPIENDPVGAEVEIHFTPINAAAVAKHASATTNEDKPGAIKAMPTFDYNDLDKTDKADNIDKAGHMNTMDNDPHATAYESNTESNTENDKMDIDDAPSAAADPGAGSSHETSTNPTDKRTVTNVSAASAGSVQETLSKQTASATNTSGSLTPSSRKRLPDSRPRTPAVAEAAASVTRNNGQWTHEETVKLLLLRAKAVAFEGIAEYLPGWDAAACEKRLSELAGKHGFKAFI